MADREPVPPLLRTASLAFGLFGLVVYGGFVVLADDVPGWVGGVQLALAIGLITVAVVELRRRPGAIRAGGGWLLGAGFVLVVALLALGAAALS